MLRRRIPAALARFVHERYGICSVRSMPRSAAIAGRGAEAEVHCLIVGAGPHLFLKQDDVGIERRYPVGQNLSSTVPVRPTGVDVVGVEPEPACSIRPP